MNTEITCAYCGIRKPYPEDFPDILYAMCTECVEAETKKEARLWYNQFLAFIKKVFA